MAEAASRTLSIMSRRRGKEIRQIGCVKTARGRGSDVFYEYNLARDRKNNSRQTVSVTPL